MTAAVRDLTIRDRLKSDPFRGLTDQIRNLMDQVRDLRSENCETRRDIQQLGASAHHVLFLVTAQAAIDVEALLRAANGRGNMSNAALNKALKARGVDIDTFWLLRGQHSLVNAHPPLDRLEAVHFARAAKCISTDANLKGFWSVAAAFLAERA